MKINRLKIYLLLLVFFFALSSKSQNTTISTKTKPVVSILGFSLCGTTITELRKNYNDLHEIEVEEMNYSSGCEQLDSRYIAKKGFATTKQPGLIFQQERDGDLIGKIRLTTDYKGKFIDNTDIDISKLKAKDVLKRFPTLEGKWGSRGCSDYWNLSNDTISFFVKIDRSKKPMYPIDEAYYLNQPIEGVDLVMSCYVPSEESFTLVETTNDPVFILDSVQVFRGEMNSVDPNTIAVVTVYKGKNATDRFGAEAENGLVYMETISFVKKRYWTSLKSKSDDYLKHVPSPDEESSIFYILNGKPLLKDHEAGLSGITNENLQSVLIIDKNTLKKDYLIEGYSWGVLITTK
ncbi:hypothetical protein HQN86_20170 [Pedobacter panaciterrae]|jgi:hypothetical protein|uniref:hypothetical protein n=1 Tax=Pedobacter panaciterrae TaxID=363849 RepID=UPI00155DD14C|nr:hypothetical protein [Pedobacter panaciterrae]NQX55949.1 hypothetical protein [Pedobacter panaciterrae]